MGLKRKERDKLYGALVFMLFKRNLLHMSNKTSFIRALISVSQAKIKDAVAAKKLLKLWRRRAKGLMKGKKKKRLKKFRKGK